VWKEVENRKADETRMEKAAGKVREERKKETDNRRRKTIARIMEGKEEEEKDLIELRVMEEMVP